MSQFTDRQKSFENKFKNDEEFNFKVNARRNKLLGLWAAGMLSLEGEEAEAYAKTVVLSDFEEPGDDDVLQKVLSDLTAGNIEASQESVRKEMDHLMDLAREQMTAESWPYHVLDLL